MSFAAPDEINPFEAPRAGIKAGPIGEPDGEAELIRRAHLGHEASVKSIGSLLYLGAILSGAGAVFMLLAALGVVGPGGEGGDRRAITWMFAAGLSVVFAIYAGLGYGLTHLQAWARWIVVVVVSLGFLNNLRQLGYLAYTNPELLTGPVLIGTGFGFLIGGYVFYLLVSPKGGVVFSRSYKEVIALTPHIRYKNSLIVKIFVGIILGVALLAIIGAILRLGR